MCNAQAAAQIWSTPTIHHDVGAVFADCLDRADQHLEYVEHREEARVSRVSTFPSLLERVPSILPAELEPVGRIDDIDAQIVEAFMPFEPQRD